MSATDLIDAYIHELVILGRADTTVRDRKELLLRVDRELPEGLDQATDDEIREWVHRPGWSKQTKASYLSTIVDFYKIATDPRIGPWLDYNPATNCPRPRVPRGVPRPVADDQMEDILARFTGEYQIWSRLAAYQGLRCIEISRLDREDVTERRTILHGKGDKPGVVVTHPDVWAVIEPLPFGPIARGRTGGRVAAQSISNRYRVYCRQKGLYGVTLHRLRHWYGTKIQEATGDIRVTQTALRHASVTSTQIYTAVADHRLRAAVDALPRFTAGRPPAAGAAAA